MLKKLIAITLMLFAAQTFAAPKQVVDQYVNAFMDSLTQKVQLSNEQKTALQPVLFNNINAREDVISSHMGQKGMSVKMQIRDALEPINQNMQSEAQNILNPEQFNAFKDVQKTNQEAVKARINQNF